MFKFVFPALVCAAMCFPAASFAQDCGCGCEPAPAPCVKTRKRLKLVDVQQQVCRTKRVCTTDECGCPTTKRVRVSETVTRKKLALVDVPVDPCRKGLLRRVTGRLRSVGSKGCCDPAPSCGCEDPCGAPAEAPCGCGSASATIVAPAAMGETILSAPMTEAAPTPAVVPAPAIEAPPAIEATPMIEGADIEG